MPLVMLKSDPRARLKPCLRCGYSLRHITDSRHCPECGLSIWISLSGNDTLDMSNPPWLRRMALASLVLAAANAALVAAAAMIHLVVGSAYQRAAARGMFLGIPDLKALMWILTTYLALSGVGLLLLGGDEGRYPERRRGLRRGVIVMGAISLLFAGWLSIALITRTARPPRFLLIVVAHAQALAGWLYLATLARRIPHRRLERLLRGLAIGVAVAGVAMILNGGLWIYLALIRPWSRRAIVWTLFLLLYPPLAIAALLYIARAFKAASDVAEKNWGVESAAGS